MLFLIVTAHGDELDRWLQDSSLVVRGEVVSAQFETPGSPFTRTRYQIRVDESFKGHVRSGLLDFTAPGGGMGGSTTDFTLGFGEQVVMFVPEAPPDGHVLYHWDRGHVLSLFVGGRGDWLVAEVVEMNARQPLGPGCLAGDLEQTDGSRRLSGQLLRHQACDWFDFLELLRARSATAQSGARSIAGAAPLPPDPLLSRRNWYVLQEDMRARFGSPVTPEPDTSPLSPW